MANQISEWRSIGSVPIENGLPQGEPVRDDPAFQQLKDQIDHLNSLSGKPPDWTEVVRSGKEIIQLKSKDLLVASYLCLGLFELHGYSGLRGGLSCLEEILTSFWDSLYPAARSVKSRISILSWLSEKLAVSVAQRRPGDGERSDIQACIYQLDVLEKALSSRTESESERFGEVKRALQIQVGSKRMEADEDRAAVNGNTSMDGLVQTNDITSFEDSVLALRQAKALILRAAAIARKHPSTVAWPFHLVRVVTWMEIEDYPPHKNQRTRIPPPTAHLLKLFESLTEQESWNELISQTESQISESPFWLDPHRFTMIALTRRGTDCSKVRDAVMSELHSLLNRLPHLADFEFSNGDPFANDETKTWLAQNLTAYKNPPAISAKSVDETLAPSLAYERGSLLQKASHLHSEGNPNSAIELFKKELSTAAGAKQRFIIRLDLAQFHFESGQLRPALSQFEALDQDINRYSLEEWEPELSSEVLLKFWRVLTKSSREKKSATAEMVRRAEGIYDRLNRLDPSVGIEVYGKSLG